MIHLPECFDATELPDEGDWGCHTPAWPCARLRRAATGEVRPLRGRPQMSSAVPVPPLKPRRGLVPGPARASRLAVRPSRLAVPVSAVMLRWLLLTPSRPGPPHPLTLPFAGRAHHRLESSSICSEALI